MISVINYGVGNLGSILNMIKKIGGSAKLASTERDILDADRFILPGVGHFQEGMKNLQASGLVPALREKVLSQKRPLLGICLGAQLLTKKSEEGNVEGLGWISAETIRFPEMQGIKIPHMGWNQLISLRPDAIIKGLETNSRFYFVHSYFMKADVPDELVAVTRHGVEAGAILRKENIVACQFHPEKSHRFGMQLLRNFLEV